MSHKYKMGYNAYMRQWNKENRDKVRAARRKYWEKNKEKHREWGMKYLNENRTEVLARGKINRQKRREEKAGRPQSAECEICGRVCITRYDHCHVTGKFRGWLCHQCNVVLGLVKENSLVLKQMIRYLEASSNIESSREAT